MPMKGIGENLLASTPTEDGEVDARRTIRLNSAFSHAPLIPAKPTGKPVTFYGETSNPVTKIRVRVGVFDDVMETDGPPRGLHIELWHLILVLLSFWAEREDPNSECFPLGFNQLWRRYKGSSSSPNAARKRHFSELIKELSSLKMDTSINDRPVQAESVVEIKTTTIVLNVGRAGETFESIKFDQNFLHCLVYAARSQDVRLDVLAGISSKLIKAAYLWLPAKACRFQHKNEAPPGEINHRYLGEMHVMTSKELMAGLMLPRLGAGARRNILLKNNASILRGLHGLPLIREGCRLGLTWWKSEIDLMIGTYVYQCDGWQPGVTTNSRGNSDIKGALWENFFKGGGSRAAFTELTNNWHNTTIEADTAAMMRTLGVRDIENYSVLYRKIICILGPDRFRDAVAVLKEADSKSADKGKVLRGILFDRITQIASKRTAQCTQRP